MFYGMIALAAILTFVSMKVRFILFRLAAAIFWVGLLLYVLLADAFSLADPWTMATAFGLLCMIFAVLVLQVVTDTKKQTWGEREVTYGRTPKEEVPSRGSQVREARRERLKAISRRR